ncbi:MAG: hypothetical protein LBR56_00985 [Sporomusaceae bacterium]|jgi:hypothetical protein|nr:hypothetical protein [Sporomusaceae bacterium]
MATIKIKRGPSANLPSLTLQEGELAVALDTGKVYIGDSAGNTILVNPDLPIGSGAGKVPILGTDGKLDAAVLPAIAVTDTFVVANQAAMLALTAQIGDVAVRTDLSKSFILKAAPATTLANWQELLTPGAPVQSVNSKTGAITLTASDVGAASATHNHTSGQITDAANTNTVNTIVKRDASGNFSAGTITANLSGKATSAEKLATARIITITGDVQGSVSTDLSGNVSLNTTISTIDGGSF